MSRESRDDDICWYHGKISRKEAEDKLTEEGGQDGLFIVRESNSSFGDFVLSVIYNGQVSHFQIRRHTEDAFFSIDENLKFHGLEVLVDHYLKNAGTLSDGIILSEYIKGEAPPHDARRFGHTNLLHRATGQGHYKIVSGLLKTGYKHEVKNQDGQTAVHLASILGKNDIINKLIDCGATVNLRDTASFTPLHYACQHNFPATVRLLVQIGNANIQARNTVSGAVPLHEAAVRGHKETVKELLSLNAPVNPRNNENLVPAQLARMNGFTECAEMLERYECPAPKTHRSEWYHGTLGRQEAEKIIRQYSSENGTYLVRFSERNKEDVLTVYHEEAFFNYIICKHNKEPYFFIDDGPYLNSLEHVVEYYSFMSDGLPTMLKAPVPPRPKPPLPEFSTIPRSRKKLLQLQHEQVADPNDNDACPNQFKNIKFTSNFKLNNNDYKEPPDEYIPRERLTLGKVVGEGEFATVYEGTYTKQGGETLNVAIKTLRNETNREAFLRESQVMIKLNHHCVVKLIGLSIEPQLLMVQELVPLGSILQYIYTNHDNINPNREFKIWAAQIACGMKYLEEQRFVHRDLAARNILLASRTQAKISDFGLSRALNSDHEYYRALQGGKWPLKWYAPESYNYGQFSHKSDVWSFGVTIWEMYSFGKSPYGDKKGSEAIELINKGGRLEQPHACPENIYEIMKRCWDIDADKRPTFSELLDIFTCDREYTNVKELLTEMDLA